MRRSFYFVIGVYLLLVLLLAIGLLWASGHEDPEIRRAAVPVFLDMIKVSFGAISTLLGAMVVLVSGVRND
jgi:hypothetical protein